MTHDRIPAAGDFAADFLPQEAPFVLLDRILALEGKTGRFVKAVSGDDPMIGPSDELPPVLLIEAMAQGAGIVLVHGDPSLLARGAMLAAVDRCEVTGTVRTGDLLEIESTIVRRYGAMARVRGEARVDGVVVATALLTLAVAAGSDT